MTAICNGHEIVCPDGRVRHYPYHNKGDADADAKHASTKGCSFFKNKSRLETSQPPCPSGKHKTRPVAFAHGTGAR